MNEMALIREPRYEIIAEIPIEKIIPNKFELRSLDRKFIQELMNSIKINGLLQPITVKPVNGSTYLLIFGLHRFEACKRLNWERIPAIVRNASSEEVFLLSVNENLQRNIRINPIAEARGYKYLISQRWTIHEIALKIGKSDSYVCRRMKILDNLHPNIKQKLIFQNEKSKLTISHAEYLTSIGDKQLQLELAKEIERKDISVHQLERLGRRKERARTLIKYIPKGCLCQKCSNYPCKLIVTP